ncbi:MULTISPECIES: prenyltransferase/squalene oxidase repeat-containing protein [unclassified Nocardioides]|uniref:prenyltransferase/squalene oxidase repeat-containing protein n=1 Tax=unclassified Nocardioides TaxID=2615069 RepID=UPI0012E3B93F|nr:MULTISPECIES: prenyltransferase/squalene oxidase repeat-containing protein [unclassified Nocardioides]
MKRTPRLASALVAGVLALGLTAGMTESASAAPSDRAGGWLDRQLTGGLVHNDQYGFDDYGLTADTGFALAAIGGHRKALRQSSRALAKHVDSWTTGVDFASSDVYAGSVAKALVFAQTVGANPRSFGKANLVQRLSARISAKKGIVGRLQDKTSGTDYANTLGQAYAAGGLSTARSGKADEAVAFLLRQQCSPGYFRLYFADATAKNQNCDGATKANRAPDTDATAIAVLSLQSIKHPTPRVQRSIAAAVRWLVRTQERNGSFGGGPSTKAPNANSTGLAASALGQAGQCVPAKRAARWVAKLQQKNGAIAYDRSAIKGGITTETRDQWRRATSQAAPGLQFLSSC